MLTAPATLLSAALLAHGAPPVATDVLVGGPPAAVVRLSRGLATASPEGFRFVCPTRWGGPDSPLSVGVGPHALVAGTSGLMVVTVDAGVSADAGGSADATMTPDEAVVALSASTTRALAADDVRAFALSTRGEVVALRPSPGAVWATIPSKPGTIALGTASVLIAGVADGELRLWTLTEAGAAVAPRTLATGYDYTPTLHSLPDGRVYVRGTSAAGFRLDRVGATGEAALVTVMGSNAPIYGPVATADGVFVATGGVLTRLDGDVPTALPGPLPLTCLRAVAGLGLVGCMAPDLVALAPDGTAQGPLFRLADLLPPSLDGLSALETASCKFDWYDVATDAGFTGAQLLPPEWNADVMGDGAEGVANDAGSTADAPTNAKAAAGCQADGGSGTRWPWLPALMALAARFSSRRRC